MRHYAYRDRSICSGCDAASGKFIFHFNSASILPFVGSLGNERAIAYLLP
jgi:hypothetical protein